MRVTFIIFGYNQERYIDEAIAGAFSQDWPDLQIILSDDCSSDATYDKMQAAAAAYRGPHTVTLNRSVANSGLLGHVYRAAALADGELLVLGAGDDVSLPNRTRRVAQAWRETGADAFFSRLQLMDEFGTTLDADYSPNTDNAELFNYFGGPVPMIWGASSAYSKRVFTEIPCLSETILFEDTYFTLMLNLRGWRAVKIEEPLVRYRQHPGAITNASQSTDPSTIHAREAKCLSSAASLAHLLSCFREAGGSGTRLASDIAFRNFQSNWMSASIWRRLRAMTAMRRRWHLEWSLARLFGIGAFIQAKRVKARLKR